MCERVAQSAEEWFQMGCPPETEFVEEEPDDYCSRCGRLLNWLQWHSDYEFDERGWLDCENENCPDSIFYME